MPRRQHQAGCRAHSGLEVEASSEPLLLLLLAAAERACVRLLSFLKGLNSSQAREALPRPADAAVWAFMPSRPYLSYAARASGSESTSAFAHGERTVTGQQLADAC